MDWQTMDWQTYTAIAIVLLAGSILLRQAIRFLRGTARGGCGSCPSNSASSRVKSFPLVQISSNSNTPAIKRDSRSQQSQ